MSTLTPLAYTLLTKCTHSHNYMPTQHTYTLAQNTSMLSDESHTALISPSRTQRTLSRSDLQSCSLLPVLSHSFSPINYFGLCCLPSLHALINGMALQGCTKWSHDRQSIALAGNCRHRLGQVFFSPKVKVNCPLYGVSCECGWTSSLCQRPTLVDPVYHHSYRLLLYAAASLLSSVAVCSSKSSIFALTLYAE